MVPLADRVIDLAAAALADGRDLASEVKARGDGEKLDYATLLKEEAVLSPVDHSDPTHCFVAGTGLTHLGSADTRDKIVILRGDKKVLLGQAVNILAVAQKAGATGIALATKPPAEAS